MNTLSQRSHEPSILAQTTAPVARALLEFQNKVAKAL